MTNDWLADIVVVNESRELAVAGDISVFRSVGEACRSLEHWWVENGEGFAFTAAGGRLILGLEDGKRVIVTGQQAAEGGPEVVQAWLRACAAAVLDARRSNAKKGNAALSPFEEKGQLPTSMEGLIAYIGFSS
ncbi:MULTISPECIES: hypothetical protein [unclassified Bradyrhizobium]|uniref:hypothetical protein n=1 Tax=unclassified Bradyrhizobium TaxID=2631580 RepID=UPI0028ECF668|nr:MULTISPECIES: hypothetical protein [unclassified Bradyrhizobium]